MTLGKNGIRENMEKKKLSPRELQILELNADGYLNKQIADILGISTNTIKGLTRLLTVKLGVKNTKHAIAEGFRQGYLKTRIH